MAPVSFPENSNIVCVMDASGRLGSTLVERLLQRGYTVHAAVQHQDELRFNGPSCDSEKLKIFRSDPLDYQSIIHALKGCSGLFYSFEPPKYQPTYDMKLQFNGPSCDSEKLRIFRTDPLDYQSIIHALKGCSGLFYWFEPPKYQPTYDEFMLDVEIRAAHNVLEACAQTETVDKVVFTSSVTTVGWRNDRKSIASDLDERHWSDANCCRKFKLWHALSKTLAEKAAWALAMDRSVNMVSINGGLLMGPELSISHPYLKGAAEMYEDGVFVTVDLKFLVDAHIRVFEDISSYGRYLCFNQVINRHEDAMKLAQMLTPSAPSPPQSYDQEMRIISQKISSKKLNQLMVDFESETQLVDESTA